MSKCTVEKCTHICATPIILISCISTIQKMKMVMNDTWPWSRDPNGTIQSSSCSCRSYLHFGVQYFKVTLSYPDAKSEVLCPPAYLPTCPHVSRCALPLNRQLQHWLPARSCSDGRHLCDGRTVRACHFKRLVISQVLLTVTARQPWMLLNLQAPPSSLENARDWAGLAEYRSQDRSSERPHIGNYRCHLQANPSTQQAGGKNTQTHET